MNARAPFRKAYTLASSVSVGMEPSFHEEIQTLLETKNRPEAVQEALRLADAVREKLAAQFRSYEPLLLQVRDERVEDAQGQETDQQDFYVDHKNDPSEGSMRVWYGRDFQNSKSKRAVPKGFSLGTHDERSGSLLSGLFLAPNQNFQNVCGVVEHDQSNPTNKSIRGIWRTLSLRGGWTANLNKVSEDPLYSEGFAGKVRSEFAGRSMPCYITGNHMSRNYLSGSNETREVNTRLHAGNSTAKFIPDPRSGIFEFKMDNLLK